MMKELLNSPRLEDAASAIFSKNTEVHTVVMGHTHVFESRQFLDGKEYLNTGTWTEVTSLELSSLGRYTKFHYALVEIIRDDDLATKQRALLREWRGRWHEDVSYH